MVIVAQPLSNAQNFDSPDFAAVGFEEWIKMEHAGETERK